jgi:hypothetical protein
MVYVRSKATWKELVEGTPHCIVLLPASSPADTDEQNERRANSIGVDARIAGAWHEVLADRRCELFVLVADNESQGVAGDPKGTAGCHHSEWRLLLRCYSNGNPGPSLCVVKTMFLHRLTDYPLSDLLHSVIDVAVCQLDPEPLKATICELLSRGHRHLVLEAQDGSLWLPVAARAINDSNVVGDARRWTRELGRQFYIKRSNEAFETPTTNSFVLPDGRVIEVRSVLVRPQNFTCWGLSTLKTLPPNSIRI